MLEYIGVIIVVGVLVRIEKKSMYGSPALMGAVTLGIGLVGYFATSFLLIKQFHVRNVWLLGMSIYLWLAIGYGVYKLIARSRENAFEKAMYDDPETGVQKSGVDERP